jgi:hypothetical protein
MSGDAAGTFSPMRGASAAGGGASTRSWLLVLDIAICAVLVLSAISVVAVRAQLHASDGDAVAIADWARGRGLTRVAWPDDRREAVPALLAAGVTPVLVPAVSPPAQLLALNATPVLVTTDQDDLASLSRDELRSGPYIARVIDLGKAGAVPIADGESIGEQISRPYVFSPLRDSRRVLPGQPWSAPVTLAAGHYLLRVAVFDPQYKGFAALSAAIGDRPLGATTPKRLETGVIEPIRVEFDVTDEAAVVQLELVVTGPPGAVGAVHEWDLHRQDARR